MKELNTEEKEGNRPKRHLNQRWKWEGRSLKSIEIGI